MAAARWVDFAGQAIFHTLVAALVIEALVRLWGVRAPSQRMGFRLLALAWPLLVVPTLFLLFPQREGEAFREGQALFSARRWDDVTFLGAGLYAWWITGMALAGLALLLLDLVPLLRSRAAAPPPLPPATPEGERVRGALGEAARALGMRVPPLAYFPAGPAVLYCTGARRPVVVVSRAAVDLLDDAELRGALAHELAHLEHRDPALSWALMGARGLMWFNPGAQVLVRALARDAERLADERGAAATGDRLALASALLKLYRATGGSYEAPADRARPLFSSLAEPIARARAHDIELRCRALLGPRPEPLRVSLLRLAAVGAGLFLLLFHVV
ncbi:MAG TPA: M56 family metallopeptidase [Anaeromyxobacteraceae bacterium]|nr:M56 family metallopeptidase [Anaeromyxobacteraceae bacterium]